MVDDGPGWQNVECQDCGTTLPGDPKPSMLPQDPSTDAGNIVCEESRPCRLPGSGTSSGQGASRGRGLRSGSRRPARWPARPARPEASGFSNDTCSASSRRAGRGRTARGARRPHQPTGFQVLPGVRLSPPVQDDAAAREDRRAVPRVRWIEEETPTSSRAVLRDGPGRGTRADRRPPYHAGGWMTEISRRSGRPSGGAAIECMARIHRLDPEARGFSFLARPSSARRPSAAARPTTSATSNGRARAPGADDRARSRGCGNEADDRARCFSGATPHREHHLRRPSAAAVLDWEMVTPGAAEEWTRWTILRRSPHRRGDGPARPRGLPEQTEETVDATRPLTGFRVKSLTLLAGVRGLPVRRHHGAHRPADGALRGDDTPSRAAPFELDNNGHAAPGAAPRAPPPDAAPA